MHREGTQKTRRLLLWRVLPNAARRVRKASTWTAGKGWPPAMGDGFDEARSHNRTEKILCRSISAHTRG